MAAEHATQTLPRGANDVAHPFPVARVHNSLREVSKPALGVFGILDRPHTLANLQWAECVEHYRQLVGALLAQRFLDAPWMRSVWQTARVQSQRAEGNPLA